MGSDVSEVQETPCAVGIKVHISMCTQLLGLVDRISKVIPDIEAAQPRCSLGIQALCQLHNAIDRARELVENCRMSSKLYLAITGETVKSRFEKIKNLLGQSLSQLQSMVPVALESKISEILAEFGAKRFCLDSCEELAGKALRAILQQDASPVDSVGNSEIELLQFAASMLHITSPKDLLIENRCLRRMLNDVDGVSISKKETLKYLLHRMRKYDKLILQRQTRIPSPQCDEACISVKHDSKSITTKSIKQGIEISVPSRVTSVYGSLETSSNSISSTASSMRDIDLRVDTSNLSLNSLDSSYSNISHAKLENSFGSIKEPSEFESHRFQFYHSIDDIREQFLSNIRILPWESQCKAIQDVHTYLISYNPSCAFVSSDNFLDPLILFLRDALDKHDRKAQIAGSQLFLIFLRASRRESCQISEDVYALLASVLATEATAEMLEIMEVLSTQVPVSKFEASGAYASIFKILDSRIREFEESALRILYNLSSSIDISSCKLGSDWTPLLVPFLEDRSVVGTCLGILGNLCKFEETRLSIAETQGCIASIIKLLENCSYEDQEHAVNILLLLCSQHDYYCDLVLREGCIPAVVHVSNNGSDKGKVIAMELLRQLREFKYEEDEREHPKSKVEVSKGGREGKSDPKSSKTSKLMNKFFKKK